jgi:hypothetical protein
MFVAAKGTAPTYQWKKNGVEIPGATKATNVIDRVSLADADSYTCVGSNSAGVVESAAAVLGVIADTVVPKVAVTAPKAKSATESLNITASGTATDTARITDVKYSLNGSAWSSVSTFTQVPKGDGNVYAANWSTPLTLAVGTNTLITYSVDYSGNTSAPVVIPFYYNVPSQLTVTVDNHDTRAGEGPGTYIAGKSPLVALPNVYATNGAYLYVTRGPYQLSAMPGLNQLFTNWTKAGGTVVSTNAKYTFNMETNLTLTANFIHNPFIEAAGIYNGLITNVANDYKMSGYASFKIDAKQAVSGSLFIDGDKVSAAGKLSVGGTAIITISRVKLGKSDLKLELAVLFDGTASGTNQIVATLTDLVSLQQSSIVADQSIYVGKPSNPYNGTYTMVLDNATTAAGGFGYGLATISTNGTVTISGGLGDSTAYKAVSAVSKDGRIPFYAQIYGGKMNYTNPVTTVVTLSPVYFGSIMGYLQVTNTSSLGGEITWVKNVPVDNVVLAPLASYANFYTNGFTNTVAVSGVSYTAPAALTPALTVTNLIFSVESDTFPVQSQAIALFPNNASKSYGSNIFSIVKVTNGVVVEKVTNYVLGISAVGTNAALGKLGVAIDPKTGLLKGTFTNAISLKPLLFFGAVRQTDNTGWGYFYDALATGAGADTNVVGAATLTPNP